MNVLIRGIILTVLVVAMGATGAWAIDPPHLFTNPTTGATDCSPCHYAGSNLNSVGFTNFCNTCHQPGGMAQLKPFSPNDASNIFNNVTSKRTGKLMQTSHNWGGSLSVPKAGAVAPGLFSPLNYAPLVGLSCDRCHAIHNPIQSATNSFPFLRMLKEQDQICFECHSPRKTTNQTAGTHPVTMGYTTAIKKFARYTTKFYLTPVNANPANRTSALKLPSGQVLCSTCHSVHYADSNSATFDNASSVLLGRFSSSEGYILRTDRRAGKANGINICTNCHKGKFAHNVKNQNIQCADCHGGHVDEADGSKPNVWLVKRYMVYSTGTYKLNNRTASKPTFFQSTTVKNYKDAASTGVCQSCHVVPQPGAPGGNWPAEHASSDAKVCNSCHYHDNPKGSFAAMDCSGCHGYPPRANVPGGPTGYAAGYTNRANEALTPHSTHIGTYAYTCDDCHKGNNHQNGVYTDVFLSPSGTKAASFGLSPSYAVGTYTCSATYCHSDGAPRTATQANGTPTPASVVWLNGKGTFTGSTTHCQKCHGDASSLQTNVHAKHVNPTTGKGYQCGICHSQTVAFTNSTTILDLTKHVNTVKEVSFAGQAAGTSFNPAAGTASCSTSSCHSNGKGTYATPKWTDAASGACGTCHDALSPTIGTVAHPTHFTAVYGPKLSTTTATSCAACHVYTTDIAATHVNGIVNVGVCTTCHQGTAPAWSTTRLNCTTCHTGTLSVIAGVTAPDKTISATQGHTQPTFTGTLTCNSCHDPNSNHITGVLGDTVRLYGTNDNTQCTSCHNVAGKTKPAFQNMSTHFTAKGGPQSMLCKQCHDPHGTANLSMIRTQLKGTWTNATTYTINYTNAVNGFVNTQTNRGLCQVCHTKTSHYRAGVPETNHATSGCLDCHKHNAAGGAFKPKGTCDACHGYPPAPRNVANLTFGRLGNYSSARFEDYSGGGGAHLIPDHVPATATASQAWANCTPCHNGGAASHSMITPIKTNIANVSVKMDQKYRFNATRQVTYTGAKLVYPGNKTGRCVNAECHFQATPSWSRGTFNPLAPAITSVAPISVTQGVATPVIITGTNLSGATLQFSNATFSSLVTSATQITATVTGTAVNTGTVTVTTGNGSDTKPFTVTAPLPAPTVSSVTPNSGVQGQSYTVTITGSNFLNGASLASSFSGTGITVNSTTYVSATQLSASITIGGTATTGLRNVTVTNGDGQTGTGTSLFTVNAPAPVCTVGTPTLTVTPATSTVTSGGTAASYTVRVTNNDTSACGSTSFSLVKLDSNAAFTSTALSPSSLTLAAGATGSATFTVAAPAGSTNGVSNTSTISIPLTVGHASPASVTATTTVSNAAPTVASITPASGAQGATNLSVTITGSNFLSGASLASSFGAGITVNSTTYVSASQLTANITISGTATAGARNVIVTNGDGQSATGTGIFTVTGPVPRTNVALAANGGVATASTQGSYPASAVNNGSRTPAGGFWRDTTYGTYPDWAAVTFNGAKTISEIDVITAQTSLTSTTEPTAGMTFTANGITAFDVQYCPAGTTCTAAVPGTGWVTVKSYTGNNLVLNTITLATPVSATQIRVVVNNALGSNSRIVEIESY